MLNVISGGSDVTSFAYFRLEKRKERKKENDRKKERSKKK